MKVIETYIPGLLIVEPDIFEDSRGYFFETYQEERYKKAGIKSVFVQDNESKSVKATLRGLHYQLAPFAQSKLVRVLEGRVYDVAVDLRKGSPAFGRWFGIELNGENRLQLYIPKGFAHGFSVLSETAVFSYKCDNFYHKPAERSVNLNDPILGIDWKLGSLNPVVSEKDLTAPWFRDAEMNFIFGHQS
ncbi:MAG: dTDP-4-dehydrorhamnose 3,5-epimerase [Prolixibacteraceae bacterium]|nr:dTDP-4-dehydrorhamnose 3,5-epimerase [Prolixibacteraceae bacterium]